MDPTEGEESQDHAAAARTPRQELRTSILRSLFEGSNDRRQQEYQSQRTEQQQQQQQRHEEEEKEEEGAGQQQESHPHQLPPHYSPLSLRFTAEPGGRYRSEFTHQRLPDDRQKRETVADDPAEPGSSSSGSSPSRGDSSSASESAATEDEVGREGRTLGRDEQSAGDEDSRDGHRRHDAEPEGNSEGPAAEDDAFRHTDAPGQESSCTAPAPAPVSNAAAMESHAPRSGTDAGGDPPAAPSGHAPGTGGRDAGSTSDYNLWDRTAYSRQAVAKSLETFGFILRRKSRGGGQPASPGRVNQLWPSVAPAAVPGPSNRSPPPAAGLARSSHSPGSPRGHSRKGEPRGLSRQGPQHPAMPGPSTPMMLPSPGLRYPSTQSQLEKAMRSQLYLAGKTFFLAVCNDKLRERLTRQIKNLGGSTEHRAFHSGVYEVLTDLKRNPRTLAMRLPLPPDPGTLRTLVIRYAYRARKTIELTMQGLQDPACPRFEPWETEVLDPQTARALRHDLECLRQDLEGSKAAGEPRDARQSPGEARDPRTAEGSERKGQAVGGNSDRSLPAKMEMLPPSRGLDMVKAAQLRQQQAQQQQAQQQQQQQAQQQQQQQAQPQAEQQAQPQAQQQQQQKEQETLLFWKTLQDRLPALRPTGPTPDFPLLPDPRAIAASRNPTVTLQRPSANFSLPPHISELDSDGLTTQERAAWLALSSPQQEAWHFGETCGLLQMLLAWDVGLEVADARDFLEAHGLRRTNTQLLALSLAMGNERMERLYAKVEEENQKIAIRVEHVYLKYRPSFKTFDTYPRDELDLLLPFRSKAQQPPPADPVPGPSGCVAGDRWGATVRKRPDHVNVADMRKLGVVVGDVAKARAKRTDGGGGGSVPYSRGVISAVKRCLLGVHRSVQRAYRLARVEVRENLQIIRQGVKPKARLYASQPADRPASPAGRSSEGARRVERGSTTGDRSSDRCLSRVSPGLSARPASDPRPGGDRTGGGQTDSRPDPLGPGPRQRQAEEEEEEGDARPAAAGQSPAGCGGNQNTAAKAGAGPSDQKRGVAGDAANRDSPAAANAAVTGKKKRRKRHPFEKHKDKYLRGLYSRCEVCGVDYLALRKHILCSQHIENVADRDLYRELDEFFINNPTVEHFIQKVRQRQTSDDVTHSFNDVSSVPMTNITTSASTAGMATRDVVPGTSAHLATTITTTASTTTIVYDIPLVASAANRATKPEDNTATVAALAGVQATLIADDANEDAREDELPERYISDNADSDGSSEDLSPGAYANCLPGTVEGGSSRSSLGEAAGELADLAQPSFSALKLPTAWTKRQRAEVSTDAGQTASACAEAVGLTSGQRPLSPHPVNPDSGSRPLSPAPLPTSTVPRRASPASHSGSPVHCPASPAPLPNNPTPLPTSTAPLPTNPAPRSAGPASHPDNPFHQQADSVPVQHVTQNVHHPDSQPGQGEQQGAVKPKSSKQRRNEAIQKWLEATEPFRQIAMADWMRGESSPRPETPLGKPPAPATPDVGRRESVGGTISSQKQQQAKITAFFGIRQVSEGGSHTGEMIPPPPPPPPLQFSTTAAATAGQRTRYATRGHAVRIACRRTTRASSRSTDTLELGSRGRGLRSAGRRLTRVTSSSTRSSTAARRRKSQDLDTDSEDRPDSPAKQFKAASPGRRRRRTRQQARLCPEEDSRSPDWNLRGSQDETEQLQMETDAQGDETKREPREQGTESRLGHDEGLDAPRGWSGGRPQRSASRPRPSPADNAELPSHAGNFQRSHGASDGRRKSPAGSSERRPIPARLLRSVSAESKKRAQSTASAEASHNATAGDTVGSGSHIDAFSPLDDPRGQGSRRLRSGEHRSRSEGRSLSRERHQRAKPKAPVRQRLTYDDDEDSGAKEPPGEGRDTRARRGFAQHAPTQSTRPIDAEPSSAERPSEALQAADQALDEPFSAPASVQQTSASTSSARFSRRTHASSAAAAPRPRSLKIEESTVSLRLTRRRRAALEASVDLTRARSVSAEKRAISASSDKQQDPARQRASRASQADDVCRREAGPELRAASRRRFERRPHQDAACQLPSSECRCPSRDAGEVFSVSETRRLRKTRGVTEAEGSSAKNRRSSNHADPSAPSGQFQDPATSPSHHHPDPTSLGVQDKRGQQAGEVGRGRRTKRDIPSKGGAPTTRVTRQMSSKEMDRVRRSVVHMELDNQTEQTSSRQVAEPTSGRRHPRHRQAHNQHPHHPSGRAARQGRPASASGSSKSRGRQASKQRAKDVDKLAREFDALSTVDEQDQHTAEDSDDEVWPLDDVFQN